MIHLVRPLTYSTRPLFANNPNFTLIQLLLTIGLKTYKIDALKKTLEFEVMDQWLRMTR